MTPEEVGERRRRETDAALRTSLEPEAEAVDRLVRAALAERPAARRAPASWRWAIAAPFLVLAAVSLRLLSPDPTPAPAPRAASAHPTSERVAVSIEGDGAFVAVVTAAGSKMILLPEERPR